MQEVYRHAKAFCVGMAVAFLLLGMLPSNTYADSTNNLLVCFKDAEYNVVMDFSAYTVGFDLSSDPKSAGAGAKSTQADFSAITIEKPFDENSPNLFLGAAKGTWWAQVQIVFYPGDIEMPPFPVCDIPPSPTVPAWSMKIELNNASLSAFATAADVGKGLFESVSVVYDTICIYSRDEDGYMFRRCWDVAKNEEL